MSTIFDAIESGVQSYARSFPVIFQRAEGNYLYDENDNAYLDFLAGAGTLNYGHNNPKLKESLLHYIEQDGITHGLDMHTQAKARFLETFTQLILKPRHMEYRVQFTGPTGANAVEAAMKVARNVTGRHNIIAFTNGFHGVSLGAMAATGNSHHRNASGIPLSGVDHFPYDGYLGSQFNTVELLDQMIGDPSSGIDKPAAVIVETIQGEGGLNSASKAWLQELQKVCRKHDMLLIIDDIQAGCGRIGAFFSFEFADISPDIVTLSKSLSGYGLPFAVTLIKPQYDHWKPGEHNGTFRGNNHAFVTATRALEEYWQDDAFCTETRKKGRFLQQGLQSIVDRHSGYPLSAKGRGLMRGLECADGKVAGRICKLAFDKGMIIETSGSESQVVKCLCPLTTGLQDIEKGLEILEQATGKVLNERFRKAS